MTLIQKALSFLLSAKRETHVRLEEQYADFKRFAQKCNQIGEQKERQQTLENIEQQLDEYA